MQSNAVALKTQRFAATVGLGRATQMMKLVD